MAPVAGRAVGVKITGGQHAVLFDGLVTAADRYLAEHGGNSRTGLRLEAPRWLPGAVYGRAVGPAVRTVARAARRHRRPPGRRRQAAVRGWVAGLPERLKTSPELRERGESIKRDLLASAGLRDWSSLLWKNTKETLRVQAADPDSELRAG